MLTVTVIHAAIWVAKCMMWFLAGSVHCLYAQIAVEGFIGAWVFAACAAFNAHCALFVLAYLQPAKAWQKSVSHKAATWALRLQYMKRRLLLMQNAAVPQLCSLAK